MNKLEALNQYLLFVKENKEYFNWQNPRQCNCGMLLKSINLYEEEDIEEAVELAHINDPKNSFYYNDIFNMYKNPNCEVTNLPFTKVVNTLTDIGFTLNELIDLEFLENTNFIVDPNHHKVNSLIQYITNWIKQEE